MTRRRRPALTIETDETLNRLVVRGWRGGELARQAGLRPIYAGSAGGWILDLHRLPDLAAFLEYRNIGYSVTEAGDAA